MKQLSHEEIERYTYDSEEERIKHVYKMVQDGWSDSGRVKEFTGRLMIDDVKDEKNYVWFAEFYKRTK
jgi:hypothetical protein